jgi:hypothetical protein
MSDMSRSRPLPSAAEHERHDRLLVAQFVAGDPLKPDEAVEAQRLVAGCAACAALAADLPAVASLVAQEPVPPRRRDFRLSPEQAEHLRGNALTRFLRRLSWPSSRAFQPAAAGVLSFGLLLVVAGYAWPDGGTVTVQAEPNVVDWSSAAPSSETVDEVAAEPAAPSMIELDAGRGAARGEALDGAAELMEESEFAESLADSQAGMSEGRAQKSRAEQGVPEAPKAESLEVGADTDIVQLPSDDEAADLAAQAPAPDSAAREADAAEESATLTSATQEVAGEDGPEELLVLLGLVLALGGSGLLLLGWLARRARDPLAP